MSISNANAVSFVRSLIGESSAKFWTNDEITLYLQFAMAKVQGELFPLLWERNKDYAYIDTVAGTDDYDAPADSFKVSHIQITETGKKVRYISEDEWAKYKYNNAGITGTDNDFFTVWFMKNLDEITDFPDSVRVYIAIEAAIMARAKNEDVTSDLINMHRDAKMAALTEVTMYNMHQIDAFSEFSEEEELDMQYVWTWKGGKIHFMVAG